MLPYIPYHHISYTDPMGYMKLKLKRLLAVLLALEGLRQQLPRLRLRHLRVGDGRQGAEVFPVVTW